HSGGLLAVSNGWLREVNVRQIGEIDKLTSKYKVVRNLVIVRKKPAAYSKEYCSIVLSVSMELKFRKIWQRLKKISNNVHLE
ncbi:hypothetical protein, partial [Klebsiella pneumoniae]